MRFQVPQFIEVEDKIFGPLTLKQFIYLLGGGAAIFLLYISLPFFLFVLIAPPFGVLAVALAFYKINNKPFINVLENAFSYARQTKIYIWKKRERPIMKEAVQPLAQPGQLDNIPELTQRKLADLTWSLNIKKHMAHEEQKT